MSIEVMKQALKALDISHAMLNQWTNSRSVVFEAYKALEQAIAEAEMIEKGTKAWADTPDNWVDDLRGGAQKWVGLTDDDIWEVFKEHDSMQYMTFSRAIEAKLREKNYDRRD
jgi:hypothetical protein